MPLPRVSSCFRNATTSWCCIRFQAFGMAGTRVGYVIAAPDVIDAFAAIRQIYSVNVLFAGCGFGRGSCARSVRTRGGRDSRRACTRDRGPAWHCRLWASPSKFGKARPTSCSCACRTPRAFVNACATRIDSRARFQLCARLGQLPAHYGWHARRKRRSVGGVGRVAEKTKLIRATNRHAGWDPACLRMPKAPSANAEKTLAAAVFWLVRIVWLV